MTAEHSSYSNRHTLIIQKKDSTIFSVLLHITLAIHVASAISLRFNQDSHIHVLKIASLVALKMSYLWAF